jgi:methionyl-tRNA formyltransferase
MITVNFFTSEKHTRPVIEALKKAKNIKLLNIYKKLSHPSTADVFIVADFGTVFPKKILTMPKHGSLCLHPSLLPQYRGASPVQHAIMNGEKETGLTIFQMDEKVDHGPIISQFKDEIRNDDTAETLYKRLFIAGAQVLVTILPSWIEGKVKTRTQDHSQATYTPTLTRKDGRINWQKSDEEIERFIRAMHPWPGSWTLVDNKRLKILKAHLENGQLVLDEIQLEGKKPITWQQFLAGHPNYRFS